MPSNSSSASTEKLREAAAPVLELVSRYYHITLDELTGTRKYARFTRPRSVCWLLMHDVLSFGASDTARVFDRDHSTILVSVRRLRKAAKKDKRLGEAVDYLKRALKPEVIHEKQKKALPVLLSSGATEKLGKLHESGLFGKSLEETAAQLLQVKIFELLKEE